MPLTDLALAVQLGDAAALVRRQLDMRHVREQHRHALVALDDDLFEIGDALDIATPTHDEFCFRQFDGAAADVDVARPDGVANFRQRYAERLQPARIDYHAVLLDEAADAGDLVFPISSRCESTPRQEFR